MYENYPKKIKTELEWLDKNKAKIIASIPAFNIAVKCQKKFTNLQIYPVVSLYGDIKIQVNFAEDLKDAVPILKWLAKKGYHQTSDPFTYIPDKSRNFKLSHKTHTDRRINLVLHFNAENSNCSFVQVGEEIKPIFELQCKEPT